MTFSWEKHRLYVNIIALTVLVAALALVYSLKDYSRVRQENQVYNASPTPVPNQASSGLGNDIYNNVSNQANDIPQANPFSQNTNPISDAYKNPFE